MMDNPNADAEIPMCESGKSVTGASAGDVALQRRIERGLRLGTMLGRDWDGASFEEVARRILVLEGERDEAIKLELAISQCGECGARFHVNRCPTCAQTYRDERADGYKRDAAAWRERAISAESQLTALLTEAAPDKAAPTLDKFSERLQNIIRRWEVEGACYSHRALEQDFPFLLYQLTALRQERDALLRDWREQDKILQEIAGLVGDEHVTCAADVLTAVRQMLPSSPRGTGEDV